MSDDTLSGETTDLTVIDGVGDAVADDLRDSGFETVSEVAEANLNGVADISGVGDTTAHDIIVHAATLVGDTTSSEDDTAAVRTEPYAIDDGDEVTFTLTISDEIFPYIIHVVLSEAVSQHQSNDFTLRDEALACARTLERAHLDGDGPDYEFTAEASVLTTLYRALKQGAADYQNSAGITSMYGEIRNIADDVNEYR